MTHLFAGNALAAGWCPNRYQAVMSTVSSRRCRIAESSRWARRSLASSRAMPSQRKSTIARFSSAARSRSYGSSPRKWLQMARRAMNAATSFGALSTRAIRAAASDAFQATTTAKASARPNIAASRGLPQFLELLERHVALEAAQVVDEQDALEVVHLVLD